MSEIDQTEHGKKPEQLNLENLNFAQLEALVAKATELAKTSFKQTEKGFRNVERSGFNIEKGQDNKYTMRQVTGQEFHAYMASKGKGDPLAEILSEGSEDRETVMAAARALIAEMGYRIIE